MYLENLCLFLIILSILRYILFKNTNNIYIVFNLERMYFLCLDYLKRKKKKIKIIV
ncbi:hypothetical protein CNEO3_340001 [Clostridium neonatale]|nr:hypothetical protein CNEO3_150001 [Clostridium neonatale]CAI3585356.1 hypothetical protein CNEO4_180002 [Clostridium neonatale]CAI3621008.1 hypothetical protein CNEO3_340001 [Clostridium neonatale]CAI3627737.1 hypothetical protein CNEO3_50002 [Clostridium neonatale]CAI3638164.1 hypothetical protein CNEO2_280001 [Clostridium neonatale]